MSRAFLLSAAELRQACRRPGRGEGNAASREDRLCFNLYYAFFSSLVVVQLLLLLLSLPGDFSMTGPDLIDQENRTYERTMLCGP